jgi:uncharacterized membrane protein
MVVGTYVMSRLGNHLYRKFLAGIIAAAPIALLVGIALWVEGIIRTLIEPLGFYFPGLGVLLALVAIYLLGVLVTSLLGIVLFRLVDRTLAKVPLLKRIYGVWKDVVSPIKSGMFRQVVLLSEAPESGRIGFTSGEPAAEDPEAIRVFVPSLPNPLDGRMLLVKSAACRKLDLSVDEALKLLASLGGGLPLIRNAETEKPVPTPTPR